MTLGWCPFAVRRESQNFGYPKGEKDQNRPLIVVSHIMDGYKSTLDNPSWREPAGVGVHFGIGRDGSVSQYINIFDASWGNGIAGSIRGYDRTNPRLAQLESMGEWKAVSGGYALVKNGVNVLNTHSISIEHEGFPDDVWTDAMVRASASVIAWCVWECERARRPLVLDASMFVRHAQIDAVNRANCPGPQWPKSRIMEEVNMLYALKNDIDELKRLAWEQAVRLNSLQALLDAVLVPLVKGDRARAEQVMRYLYTLAGKEWV
jgi:N-acetylmuramoyl-L-alanine amidase